MTINNQSGGDSNCFESPPVRLSESGLGAHFHCGSLVFVVSAVYSVLQVEHLAEHYEIKDAERNPAQEHGNQIGRYLKALLTAVHCQIGVAATDPHAVPYDAVDAEGKDGEHDEEEKSGSASPVALAGRVCLFCKCVDQIPLVEAQSYDSQKKG